jgi:hypothetical protein
MAYPADDQQSLLDGVNVLLSGPGGLGQDFKGFSSYTDAWITGNFREPYTVISYNLHCIGANASNVATTTTSTSGIVANMLATGTYISANTTVINSANSVITLSSSFTNDFDDYITFTPPVTANLYVANIALGTSTLLDPYTWKFEFASAQAKPPFALGSGITVAGVTPSDYDGTYDPIGVVQCTTTYVIARTRTAYSVSGAGTGGNVTYYQTSTTPKVFALSTDCNSKVNVTGGTDRVFVSAQLNNIISYTATTSSDLWYTVAINRYQGFPNNDPVNPGYYFATPGQRLSIKTYKYTGLTGTGVLDEVQTIFSSFADSNIAPGYYWYIMDVSFQVQNGGNLQVTQSKLNLRSMTTQVVKQ